MHNFVVASLSGRTGNLNQFLNQAGKFLSRNVVVGPAKIAVPVKDFGDGLLQRFAPVGCSLFVSQAELSNDACFSPLFNRPQLLLRGNGISLGLRVGYDALINVYRRLRRGSASLSGGF